jgi:hypothetical protein
VRCKRDYEARGGRSRWDGYDVARELERSAQPLTKETLIRHLGGGLTTHNRLRAAITEGLVEVTPEGRYRSAYVRPAAWCADGPKGGNGPRIAPAHAKGHVRRHRPGVRP